MSKNIIDYSILIDDAMHLIVKKSLQILSSNEIHPDHHFFISFVTKYPGVGISEKLSNKYPFEMTIILQHQYENLIVNDNNFSVELSFDGQKEKIIIPFAALTAFADPSVKFGLQFRHVNEVNNDGSKKISSAVITSVSNIDKKVLSEPSKDKSNIINLDFRNKKIIES